MIPILILSKDAKLIGDYVDKLKIGNLFSEVIPSTKEYSIEDIKGLIKETKIFHPKIRIYFLANFHLSSIPAQNSFLKLLEEPPTNVQFVLSTNNKNNLLPTIVSRVKIIKLRGNDSQNVVGAQFIAPIIEGLNLVKFTITDRESANDILRQIIIFFRERLEVDKNSPSIIKEIIRLKALLENNNLNPQLTIDQALIFIWKKYTMK
ncbi:hypothetical protein HZA75_07820 [Candidatus Roizmanbacteria bacterium]|nr:hypothetical protein [Candidatus Roizmanbacteria bacterium]